MTPKKRPNDRRIMGIFTKKMDLINRTTSGGSDPGAYADSPPSIQRRILTAGPVIDGLMFFSSRIYMDEECFEAIMDEYVKACQEQDTVRKNRSKSQEP